jgi:hypothetical protein
MNKLFSYIYQHNCSNKELKKEDLYPGERIMAKTEEIKYEDE